MTNRTKKENIDNYYEASLIGYYEKMQKELNEIHSRRIDNPKTKEKKGFFAKLFGRNNER